MIASPPDSTSPPIAPGLTTIAGTGLRTTRLGFGTAGLMRIPTAAERAQVLAVAWDAGIRHFDTAPIYGLGESERALGRFLRARPETFTVTTKFGLSVSPLASRLAPLQNVGRAVIRHLPAVRNLIRGRAGNLYRRPALTGMAARASLERSLRALQRDRVDLFLAHDCSTEQLDEETLIEALTDLRARGLIGAFGTATNHETTLRLLDVRPRLCPVVQFEQPLHESVASTIGRHHGVITHSAIGGCIARLSQSPPLRQRWSEELDLDLTARQDLIGLCLRAALASNAFGIVLFQSTTAAHIVANAKAAAQPLEPDRLRCFQRLAAALMPAPPASA